MHILHIVHVVYPSLRMVAASFQIASVSCPWENSPHSPEYRMPSWVRIPFLKGGWSSSMEILHIVHVAYSSLRMVAASFEIASLTCFGAP